jgi:hypothetical protein
MFGWPYNQLLAADIFGKVAIVADVQQRAVVGDEGIFQFLNRGQIQVVCRLVQNKQVWVAGQHFDDLQPRFLAAAQLLYFQLAILVRIKQVVAHDAHDCFFAGGQLKVVVDFGHGLAER